MILKIHNFRLLFRFISTHQGDGYIIFCNSCPLSGASIVCEKRNYKQLNFFQYQQLPFCYKYEGQSWSLYLVYGFILSHIFLISMASKELRMRLSIEHLWNIAEFGNHFSNFLLSKKCCPDFLINLTFTSFEGSFTSLTTHLNQSTVSERTSNIVTQRINLSIFRLTQQCCSPK